MLASVEKLIDFVETEWGASKKVGNHSVLFKNGHAYYSYHETVICDVDFDKKEITIDNGGYNTSSTTRAINDYIRHYANKKYAINDMRK